MLGLTSVHLQRGRSSRGLETAPHRNSPLRGTPKPQLGFEGHLQSTVIPAATHKGASSRRSPGGMVLIRRVVSAKRLFLISGSRHSPPSRWVSPFLVNKLWNQTIQAQRKEEENDFASCLLWGNVASRGQRCWGRSVPSVRWLLQLSAQLSAAAPSFRKGGEALLKCPANTPPLLVCIYRILISKAVVQENHYLHL